ncbi:hypothetical protein AB0A69_09265 [Streptomyces sp. NPDC045431]|uniref:hypothetical protein n=1 Tax=Streptomyces sp. NPDC045431 TaxID=3155613 RepID=UPI0033CA149F
MRRSRPATNPFPPHLLPSAPAPAAARAPYDRHWWVPPLVATVLAVVLAVVCSAPLREGGEWNPFALGYLVPLGMVAASWFVDRTTAGRGARIGLGAAGCLLSAAYMALLTPLALIVFFVMLLTGNVTA